MNSININTSSIATTVVRRKKTSSVGTEYRPKAEGGKASPISVTKPTRGNVAAGKSVRRRKPLVVRAVRAFIKFTSPISDETTKSLTKTKNIAPVAVKPVSIEHAVIAKKSAIRFKENTANKVLSFFLKFAMLSLFLFLVSSVLLRSIEVEYAVKMQEAGAKLAALETSIIGLNAQLSELKSFSRLSEYAKQFGLELSYDRIRYIDEEAGQNAH